MSIIFFTKKHISEKCWENWQSTTLTWKDNPLSSFQLRSLGWEKRKKPTATRKEFLFGCIFFFALTTHAQHPIWEFSNQRNKCEKRWEIRRGEASLRISTKRDRPTTALFQHTHSVVKKEKGVCSLRCIFSRPTEPTGQRSMSTRKEREEMGAIYPTQIILFRSPSATPEEEKCDRRAVFESCQTRSTTFYFNHPHNCTPLLALKPAICGKMEREKWKTMQNGRSSSVESKKRGLGRRGR